MDPVHYHGTPHTRVLLRVQVDHDQLANRWTGDEGFDLLSLPEYAGGSARV